ncbi:unnamed protein product [Closterium sp. NIES-65]|nr:unnamed protein product [Closterium sp. NIES-65]
MAGEATSSILQFATWQSSVDVSFWEKLASLKVDSQGLKEEDVAIHGEIGLRRTVMMVITVESFQAFDRRKMMEGVAQQCVVMSVVTRDVSSIVSGRGATDSQHSGVPIPCLLSAPSPPPTHISSALAGRFIWQGRKQPISPQRVLPPRLSRHQALALPLRLCLPCSRPPRPCHTCWPAFACNASLFSATGECPYSVTPFLASTHFAAPLRARLSLSRLPPSPPLPSSLSRLPPSPPLPSSLSRLPPSPPLPSSLSRLPPSPPLPSSLSRLPPSPPLPSSLSRLPPSPPLPSSLSRLPPSPPLPSSLSRLPPSPPLPSSLSRLPPSPPLPSSLFPLCLQLRPSHFYFGAEAIEKECERWRQEGSGRGPREVEAAALTGEAEGPEGGKENGNKRAVTDGEAAENGEVEEGRQGEKGNESASGEIRTADSAAAAAAAAIVGETASEALLSEKGAPFFLLQIDTSATNTSSAHPSVTAHPLTEYQRLATPNESLSSSSPSAPPSLLVAFFDPCHLPLSPGWPLRNLLLLASLRWQVRACSSVSLAFSPPPLPLLHHHPPRPSLDLSLSIPPMPPPSMCSACGSATVESTCTTHTRAPSLLYLPLYASLPGHVSPPDWLNPITAPATCPSATGWELNTKGRTGARCADLAPLMDPTRLADEAASLNLKLMRWRVLPQLQLERLNATKCLLLGAGTLGCQVARSLLAWGIRDITLVDYGAVSYSNPRTSGHRLAIPMPGHPVSPSEAPRVQADVTALLALVRQSDAVFLLTDTRESRWLPTLLCAAEGKVAINAALGFDSFLVMRHGAPLLPLLDTSAPVASESAPAASESAPAASESAPAASESAPSKRLGCYFCNDVVAPLNSTAHRTLDQQCTVTRPGLATIAGALAVELLVGLLHHPMGVAAPAEDTSADGVSASASSHLCSPLGPLPHQLRGFLSSFPQLPITGFAFHQCTACSPMLRGFLSSFSQLPITGFAFPQCTACSPTVVSAYRERRYAFLMDAFNDPTYLERITGLDKLHAATVEIEVDWDDSEDDNTGIGSTRTARKAAVTVPIVLPTLLPNNRYNAKCLDGSPPGYYFRPGFRNGASSWHIHLPPGGWCSSLSACANRSTTFLGSSKPERQKDSPYSNASYAYLGILSTGPYVNRAFRNWNLVVPIYCDGGGFQGTAGWVKVNNSFGIYMDGWNGVKAVLADVKELRGMQSAERVLLSGQSAGAETVLMQYKHMREYVSMAKDHQANPRQSAGAQTVLTLCEHMREYAPNAKTIKCLMDSGSFTGEVWCGDKGFQVVYSQANHSYAPNARTIRCLIDSGSFTSEVGCGDEGFKGE